MRNPNWQRDELVLALDLYFQLKNRGIDKSNPQIIELSNLLNQLPFHTQTNVNANFRNPNGVAMKLSNFSRLDPNHTGKGLQRGGKLEEVIWNEFQNNQTALHQQAQSIKAFVYSQHRALKGEKPDYHEQDLVAREGGVLTRIHTYRERKPSLAKQKKKSVLKATGKLACEVCNFNFHKRYGALGEGFIECHHLTPISELKPDQTTTLDDLALVCSNCHRMLHRMDDPSDLDGLRKLLKRKAY